MQINPEILVRIDKIDWFSRCGQPFDMQLPIETESVRTWKKAVQECKKLRWENTTLEANNAITVYLGMNYHDEYQEWNEVSRPGREFLLATVKPKLLQIQNLFGAEKSVVDCVTWDVLVAICEDAYSQYNLPVKFGTMLLAIYEKGHFPCGWTGGEWPNGKLLVF